MKRKTEPQEPTTLWGGPPRPMKQGDKKALAVGAGTIAGAMVVGSNLFAIIGGCLFGWGLDALLKAPRTREIARKAKRRAEAKIEEW